MNNQLMWDELATIYDRENGGRRARTLPMDQVFDWAAKQTIRFKVTEDGGLELREVEE